MKKLINYILIIILTISCLAAFSGCKQENKEYKTMKPNVENALNKFDIFAKDGSYYEDLSDVGVRFLNLSINLDKSGTLVYRMDYNAQSSDFESQKSKAVTAFETMNKRLYKIEDFEAGYKALFVKNFNKVTGTTASGVKDFIDIKVHFENLEHITNKVIIEDLKTHIDKNKGNAGTNAYLFQFKNLKGKIVNLNDMTEKDCKNLFMVTIKKAPTRNAGDNYPLFSFAGKIYYSHSTAEIDISGNDVNAVSDSDLNYFVYKASDDLFLIIIVIVSSLIILSSIIFMLFKFKVIKIK